MKPNFLCMLLFLLSGAGLQAQDVINTDRPDKGDGTHIVEKKHFQIESGAQFARLDEQTRSFENVTLLRYGVSKKFEIRLVNEYDVVTDTGSTKGVKPPVIGCKYLLCKQKGLLPKLTLVSYLNLPVTISPDFPGNHFGYTLILAARHDLDKKMKVYSNVGFAQDQQSADISYLTTLELNYNISEHLSSFIEYFGNYAPHTNAANGMNIGFIYALKNNFSIDISTGSSTLHVASDRFVALGMSLRLPGKSSHPKNNS